MWFGSPVGGMSAYARCVVRPRPPFANWPVHWELGRGRVWIVPEPLALVSQYDSDVATVAESERYHDALDEIVALGVLGARTKLIILCDWRTIRRVEPGLREAWLRRSKRSGNPFGINDATYVATGANSAVRTTLRVAAIGLQLALGHAPVSFVDDPAPVLERHRIAAPPADFLDKIRRVRTAG